MPNINREPQNASQLRETIKRDIVANGPMSFKAFMQNALYHKDWGYYTTHVTIGPSKRAKADEGEFITQPIRYSPDYGIGIANIIGKFTDPKGANIQQVVSIASGTGVLDADILNQLEKNNKKLYEQLRYVIVEQSPRQRDVILTTLGHHVKNLGSRLEVRLESGIDYLKANAGGLHNAFVVSNEWLDAMPVMKLRWNKEGNRWDEVYIDVDPVSGKFKEVTGAVQSPGDVAHFFSLTNALGRQYLPPNISEQELRLKIGELIDKNKLRSLPIEPLNSFSNSLFNGMQNYQPEVIINSGMIEIAQALSQALVSGSGVALTMDYGLGAIAPGQSVRAFGKGLTNRISLEEALQNPGENDMTSDVDWGVYQAASRILPPVGNELTTDIELVHNLGDINTRTIRQGVSSINQENYFLALLQANGYGLSNEDKAKLKTAQNSYASRVNTGIVGLAEKLQIPHDVLLMPGVLFAAQELLDKGYFAF